MRSLVWKIKPPQKSALPKIAAAVFSVSIMLLIIIKPSVYINSARNGFLLFASTVLPSLFPFFFFSIFLTKLGVAGILSKAAKKPFAFLYNAPAVSAYIFVLSVLSGYPVGARLISDFYTNGMLDSRDAQKCSSFCSTSNPVFIIGTVGAIMLKDIRFGAVILVSHYVAALLNGLIYRGKKSDLNKTFNPVTENCDNILSETISAATSSMLFAGGYICIFTILLEALRNLGVMTFFASLFSKLIPAEVTYALCSGLIEMTRGCLMTSELAFSNSIKAATCCAVISFGGLSVIAQNVTFLSKCRVKISIIVLQKITHALIGFVICFLLSLFIK